MKPAQIFTSHRSVLIVIALFINAFVIAISYTNNWGLLWLLLITIPLLAFTFLFFPRKEKGILGKYFLWQKMNAINANLKPLPYNDPDIPVTRADLSITIGNDSCAQPYKTGIYNIRVMDSIEESTDQKTLKGLSPNDDKERFGEIMQTYHFTGGEKMIQIGSSYAGCRTDKGDFDAKKFKQNARHDSVKMIELNLSDANRQVEDIFSTSGIENSDFINDSFSFSTMGFTVFSNAEGMIHFLDTLRKLSGGKPIGIRISIRNKKKFYQICHAIMKSGISPDFIVVEGADKSAGFETNRLRMSLYEALLFVSKTLQVYGIDKEIKIIAAADIVSGFDLLKLLALGANAVCSEMPGYRVIKQQGNDLNQISMYKSEDITDFHRNILDATARLMEANKLSSPADITIAKLLHRLDLFFSKNQAGKFGSEKELNRNSI